VSISTYCNTIDEQLILACPKATAEAATHQQRRAVSTESCSLELGAFMVTFESVDSSSINSQNLKKFVPLLSLADERSMYIVTKGVFDILHAGHLSLFSYLSTIKDGHKLVVGISSDIATKRRKGCSRPINNELLRVQQICNLEVVDFVFLHTDHSFASAIDALKPAVYVKGMDTAGDFSPETIFSQNDELHFMPEGAHFIRFCDDGAMSTTQIISRVLEQYQKP
jgi:bifunctional ADP-heptose synthase (sugar kinase/adenylyltransferase)